MGCSAIQAGFTCQTDRTPDTGMRRAPQIIQHWAKSACAMQTSGVNAGFIDHKLFIYAQSWAFCNGDVGQEER